MNAISRGDLFMTDLPGAGFHPSVVVTRQEAIHVRSSVTVVLVTSTVRGHPAEVPLDVEHGLSHSSVANCDEIYTVSKNRLVRRLGSVPLQGMRQLEHAIRLSLDLG